MVKSEKFHINIFCLFKNFSLKLINLTEFIYVPGKGCFFILFIENFNKLKETKKKRKFKKIFLINFLIL